MSETLFTTSQLTLADTPSAVSWARRHTVDVLRCWGVPSDLVETARLLVSELTTNAIRHTQPDVGLSPHSPLSHVRVITLTLRSDNAKVWATPPERMSASWVAERVAPVDLDETLRVFLGAAEPPMRRWGPNSTFAFPGQGWGPGRRTGQPPHACPRARPARLEARRIHPRGRFGTWRYEIGNMDHAVKMGIDIARRLIRGEAEELVHPGRKPAGVGGGRS